LLIKIAEFSIWSFVEIFKGWRNSARSVLYRLMDSLKNLAICLLYVGMSVFIADMVINAYAVFYSNPPFPFARE
jgi:hypothetical protein